MVDALLRLLLRGVRKAFVALLLRVLRRLALRLLLLSALTAVVAAIGFRLLPVRLRELLASLPSALSWRMMQRMPKG